MVSLNWAYQICEYSKPACLCFPGGTFQRLFIISYLDDEILVSWVVYSIWMTNLLVLECVLLFFCFHNFVYILLLFVSFIVGENYWFPENTMRASDSTKAFVGWIFLVLVIRPEDVSSRASFIFWIVRKSSWLKLFTMNLDRKSATSKIYLPSSRLGWDSWEGSIIGPAFNCITDILPQIGCILRCFSLTE